MKTYDAIVIGAGPAGVTAAIYLARFGVSVAIVEKMTPGGLLLQTAEIENYPGVSSAKGYELADTMAAQLAKYSNVDKYQETVTLFEPIQGRNRLRVGEDWLEAKTVIICSGLILKKLGLPDEDKLTGYGVSYCALCDGHFYKDKVVGVVGGGNAALEEAMYLATLVKELHLFHRRGAFRADKIYQDKIAQTPNVTLHFNAVVTRLHGQSELKAITVSSTASPESRFMPLDGLFVFVGQTPALDFMPASLNVDKEGYIITDTEMRTNLHGVFAAGDIRSKLCRQVATAVGEGATAANAAYVYLERTNAI